MVSRPLVLTVLARTAGKREAAGRLWPLMLMMLARRAGKGEAAGS